MPKFGAGHIQEMLVFWDPSPTGTCGTQVPTLHVEPRTWRSGRKQRQLWPLVHDNRPRPSPTARCTKAAKTDHQLDYDLTIMTIIVLWL